MQRASTSSSVLSNGTPQRGQTPWHGTWGPPTSPPWPASTASACAGDAARDAWRLESGTAEALGGDSAPGRSCGAGPLSSGSRHIVVTEPGLLAPPCRTDLPERPDLDPGDLA